MSETYCTVPWTDLFIHWNKITCCCRLIGGEEKYFIPTQLWEAWDSFDEIVVNSDKLKEMRSRMRLGKLDHVCKGKNNCNLRKFDESIDTTTDRLQLRKVSVSVTSRCQSRCHYCKMWKPGSAIDPPEPTQEQVKSLVEQLILHSPTKIDYTGGEPLILSDNILDIYMQPIHNNIQVQVVTNGLGLTRERWKKWFSNKNSFLRITVDTMNPEVYSRTRGYNNATEFYRRLKDIFKGCDLNRVGFSITITRSNLEDVVGVLDYAMDIGVRYVNINPVDSVTDLPSGENIFGEGANVETCLRILNLIKIWEEYSRRRKLRLYSLDRLYYITKNLLRKLQE